VPRVVAEVVIQAQLGDIAGFQQRDGFVRPIDAPPTRRRHAFVIEIYAHRPRSLARVAAS
jgi:hypothetical protein